MFKKMVMVVAAGVCMAPLAVAAEYPTVAYDAQYTVTSGKGQKTAMRLASDGKGKFMTETESNGQKFGSVADYKAGVCTSIMHAQKMCMTMKLPAENQYANDEESIKKKGGKSLGTKVVDGHPCHGWEFDSKGNKTESWIGDDCKCVVHSVTSLTTGDKTTLDLKSVNNHPAVDLFQVPAGYKVMKTGA